MCIYVIVLLWNHVLVYLRIQYLCVFIRLCICLLMCYFITLYLDVLINELICVLINVFIDCLMY